MNQAECIETRIDATFSLPQLRDARALAGQTKRSVGEVLEEQTGLDPESIVKALGDMLHYPVFLMEDLHRLIPAFEILPFAEALERDCVMLRDEAERLIMIMSDPFSIGLQAWAEQRIPSAFSWGL
ncbi:MAG: type II/IV secretion system protein, partial [Sideroxydans sp.]